MKRTKFLRYLRKNGYELLREGSRHFIWLNPNTGEQQAVPRHAEVAGRLAKIICRGLSIEPLKEM